jgi:hypothetical protein
VQAVHGLQCFFVSVGVGHDKDCVKC